jgi:hypothetical protein
MNALRATISMAPAKAASGFANTLGGAKKKMRIRTRKNEVAACFSPCRAWRRSVIDIDPHSALHGINHGNGAAL